MTKAEALQANEIYIHACELLIQRVADQQKEINELKEKLRPNNRLDVVSIRSHSESLARLFKELEESK